MEGSHSGQGCGTSLGSVTSSQSPGHGTCADAGPAGDRFQSHPFAGSGLQFRWVAREGDTNSPADLLPCQGGPGREQKLRVLREVVLSGDDVESAGFTRYGADQKELAVVLTLEASGKFAEATAKNVGRQLAVVWNGRVITAPIVQTAITSRNANIAGAFTDAEARQLLDLLNHRTPGEAQSQ